MELEWNPLSKPIPGREAEFVRLFKLMRSLRAFQPELIDRAALDRRWNAIQITPYETLQAPRVGADAAADQWALWHYRNWINPTQTEAEYMREMQGYYVLELIPPCDGLPEHANGGRGAAELFSFRAQLLCDCEEIIGFATLTQCYRSCLAPALESLGDDLQALATQYADKKKVTQTESVSGPDVEVGRAAEKLHIVISAAKWCKYWSARGHGLATHWLTELT